MDVFTTIFPNQAIIPDIQIKLERSSSKSPIPFQNKRGTRGPYRKSENQLKKLQRKLRNGMKNEKFKYVKTGRRVGRPRKILESNNNELSIPKKEINVDWNNYDSILKASKKCVVLLKRVDEKPQPFTQPLAKPLKINSDNIQKSPKIFRNLQKKPQKKIILKKRGRPMQCVCSNCLSGYNETVDVPYHICNSAECSAIFTTPLLLRRHYHDDHGSVRKNRSMKANRYYVSKKMKRAALTSNQSIMKKNLNYQNIKIEQKDDDHDGNKVTQEFENNQNQNFSNQQKSSQLQSSYQNPLALEKSNHGANFENIIEFSKQLNDLGKKYEKLSLEINSNIKKVKTVNDLKRIILYSTKQYNLIQNFYLKDTKKMRTKLLKQRQNFNNLLTKLTNININPPVEVLPPSSSSPPQTIRLVSLQKLLEPKNDQTSISTSTNKIQPNNSVDSPQLLVRRLPKNLKLAMNEFGLKRIKNQHGEVICEKIDNFEIETIDNEIDLIKNKRIENNRASVIMQTQSLSQQPRNLMNIMRLPPPPQPRPRPPHSQPLPHQINNTWIPMNGNLHLQPHPNSMSMPPPLFDLTPNPYPNNLHPSYQNHQNSLSYQPGVNFLNGQQYIQHCNMINREREAGLVYQSNFSRPTLPQIEINGIPTPLNNMSTVDLQYFVIKLLRHLKLVTSNAHLKPPWWPFDIPWKNIQNDPRPVREQKKKPWRLCLQEIIKSVYHFYEQKDVDWLLVSDDQIETFDSCSNIFPCVSAVYSGSDISSPINQNMIGGSPNMPMMQPVFHSSPGVDYINFGNAEFNGPSLSTSGDWMDYNMQ